MFYRRKIILAILQAWDTPLSPALLQSLLFLFTVKQANPAFDFVPGPDGPHSFSLAADLAAMLGHGYLAEKDKGYEKADPQDYSAALTADDRSILAEIGTSFKTQNSTYPGQEISRQYPYYAADTPAILRSKESGTVLFTIGYEGISPEAYLNRLINNGVRLLVDVRNNPISRKFGFSKGQLQPFCEAVGIGYIHLPQLGIRSEQRQELNTQADYDRLFNKYARTTLQETVDDQERILELLRENKRIALTCFEADARQCHRKYLSEAIMQLPGWKYEIRHI